MTELLRLVDPGRPQSLGPAMPHDRRALRSHLKVGLAYLACYVLLDWVSFIHPIASLGITPWNPPTGLSVALVLLFGRSFVPWLFAAPLVADALVRQLPLPVWGELVAAAIIGGAYGTGALVLRQAFLRFDIAFDSTRDLLGLVVVAAVSAAVVALAHVGLVVGLGLLPPSQFAAAALRYWVGDMIGLTVVTPFILVLFTGRPVRLAWELLLPLALVLAALWLTVNYAGVFSFPLFYLLFLPVTWMALRFGLEGVTIGLAVTQIGLMAAIQVSGDRGIDVTAYQALMIVLAVTALAIGTLVREQQRTEQHLRLHQEALARAGRVGSMGEFAAALAHEINQPLTAITNYTRLARDTAEQRPADTATIAEATRKAAEQVERASLVVRRLREFIRLGRTEAASVPVDQVVEETLQVCKADLDAHGVAVEVFFPRDLPPVRADSLQVQQVLVNLVRNATEALTGAARTDGHIAITAARDGEFVVVEVRDNGPGFDAALVDRAVVPFTSTKPEGMGLGLSLCRSIVEAHGGRLTIGGGPTGAQVRFTLPIAGTHQ